MAIQRRAEGERKTVRIRINEKEVDVVAGMTMDELHRSFRPESDVCILNGFPAPGESVIREDDELFFITRGVLPAREDLEYLMMARHTPGVHEKLKRATVGIAGVGGLGSNVATALARVGIGTLIIADFDVVEPSNLNRQHYFVDQLGLPKVAALTDTLRRINPYLTVKPHHCLLNPDNVPEIFATCRVVVEAFDRAEMKSMLVETVLVELPGSVVVAASGLAGFGPSNEIVTRKISGRFWLVGDMVSAAAPGAGLMAPRVGIAASHQANQVVRIILGEE